MDFRILGPLEVRDGGRPIELPRQKERALLAALLLRVGQLVSRDALIEALWGEEAPPTARSALRNYVSQLRTSLGASVVLSRSGGYQLDIQTDELDSARFERLVVEARQSAGPERVEKLREALALWRGPPLADFEFETFAIDECRRLEELRIAALEDRMDAELSLGQGVELVGEIESLIAQNPFRERLRGQLILALYQGGRQAEALEAYQQTRRLLVEELGIEPSEALRELEQAVLRQDPRLVAPGVPAHAELPPTHEERRRTVTVLFVEVSYPPELDPELLRATTVRVLNAVRAVLEEHGGTIEQRSGDELMAVFGVPSSHEDDALRAARAALELQRAVAAQADVVGRSGWPRIDSRVGIASGEVLAGADETGHGFVTGPPVALAKRLSQDASPGDIRASAETCALLGGAVRTETVRDAPGAAATIVTVVEGVPALQRHLEAPMVGREAELAALRKAFRRIGEARGARLFLVLGEAGIGKTRLAQALANELEREVTVLTGRCVSYGKGAAYLPLIELVREALARADVGELLASDEHAELITTTLAGLAGDAEAPISRSDMFWAVGRLFEALARERPVLAIFEDLHWAEPTLLDLVDYLANREAALPIFLLGLARPELVDEREAWCEIPDLTLDPLSPKAGAALIDNLAEIPAKLRATIVRAAGGNPLYLEQLLAHASEGGDPETAPRSLAALLASRLDALGHGELTVLQRAAVIGTEFDRAALVQLVPPDEAARVGDSLQALAQRGFLQGDPARRAGRFQHVLVRDAAYGSLPKALRAELHERVARWLEHQPASADEAIGFHLEQAHGYLTAVEAGALRANALAQEAGKWLGEAGLRAWKRADTTGTIDLLGRASALLPPLDAARLELLCELGLALRTAGEIDRANQVLGEAAAGAAAEGERRIELRARMELANVHLSTHPEGGADALLELAEAAMPTFEAFRDDRSLGRAWLLAGYVHGGLHCLNTEWLEAAEHARVYYRRSGWPSASCLGEIATSLYYGPTPVPEAIRRCRSLLEIVEERTGEAHVLVWLGGLEAFAGRRPVGRRLVRRAQAVYEDLGHGMPLVCGCYPVLAEIELGAGRLAAAEALLRASCEGLETMRERACLASRAAELADVIYRRGRYPEAETWFRVAEEHAATDDAGAQVLAQAIRAKILARRGSLSTAESAAREAAALAKQTDALNTRAKVLLDLAEVLRLSGRPDEAESQVESALELYERKGNVAALERTRRRLQRA